MGPLHGLKVIEIAGLGPAPFAGMMLADMGADVIRVERPGGGLLNLMPHLDIHNRGKRCIALNLKSPEGVATLLTLLENADGLIEGFRPGVMEKLGLAPDICLARNPKLVYGRMTGWGQDGPLANSAGHDINYISLTGTLHAIGRAGDKPAVPLNLVGDFGGGGMLLAFGMACAFRETAISGKGQVIDAAMTEGAALLMGTIYSAIQIGFWKDERGVNMLDSGAHFYDVYATADNKYISIGAVEKQFYGELLECLGLKDESLPDQNDPQGNAVLHQRFIEIFRSKTRDEWADIFEGRDACFTPVLSMSEVRDHPQHRARGTFIELGGTWQPRPLPRFSRTDGSVRHITATAGEHTDSILREHGYQDDVIAKLRTSGVVA